MTPSTKARARIKRNLPLIRIFRGLHYMEFGVAIWYPFLLTWAGLDFFGAMTLDAIYMAVTVIVSVPSGIIADRIGHRIVLVLAGIAGAGGAVLYGSVPAYPLLVAGAVLWGVSTGLAAGTDEALLCESLRALDREDELDRELGRLHAADHVAIALAAPIGSALAATLGMRIPVLLFVVPSILSVGIAIALIELRGPKRPPAIGEIVREASLEIRNNASLRAIILDLVVVTAIAWALSPMQAPILQRAGVALAFLGTIYTVTKLAPVPIMARMGLLTKRWTVRCWLVRGTTAGAGLMLALLAIEPRPAVAIFAVLVFSILTALRVPILLSSVHERLRRQTRTTVASLIAAAMYLAGALSYPLLGRLFEWSLGGTLAVLGLFLILFACITPIARIDFDEGGEADEGEESATAERRLRPRNPLL